MPGPEQDIPKEASSMVRSSWIGSLVGVLACAVLVHAQGRPSEQYVTVTEAGKPAQKCRVLKTWNDNQGNRLQQVQALDSGEIMTILDPGAGRTMPPRNAALASRLFRWGSENTPPQGTPAPPPGAVVMAAPKPRNTPTLWSWLFNTSSPRTTTAVVEAMPASSASAGANATGLASKAATPAANATGLVKTAEPPKDAPIQAVKPDTWRESWGKVQPWKAEDARTAQAASAGSDKVQPASAPVPPPSAGPSPTTPPAPPPQPLAMTGPEPCNCMLRKSRPGLLSGLFGQKDVVCSKCDKVSERQAVRVEPPLVIKETTSPPPPEQPVVTAAPQPVAAPSAVPARLAGTKQGYPTLLAHLTATAQKAQPPAPADPRLPPGLGPVHAVASPRLAAGPPVPRPSVSASAPNAFTVVLPGPSGTAQAMMGGMPGGMMQPFMLSQAGVPDGMGNAFTTAGSSRPIPADLTRSYYDPNAFHENGGMGGANRRPPIPMAYVGPTPAMMPGMVAAVPLPMAMPSPATTGQLLAQLRDSMMPSVRELAAEELSRCDWRSEPNVVHGLVQAAQADPAPAVRASCVRALGRMKANTVPVVTTVQALKADSDLRVRREAEQALPVLLAP
jgi:hypothetical protein